MFIPNFFYFIFFVPICFFIFYFSRMSIFLFFSQHPDYMQVAFVLLMLSICYCLCIDFIYTVGVFVLMQSIRYIDVIYGLRFYDRCYLYSFCQWTCDLLLILSMMCFVVWMMCYVFPCLSFEWLRSLDCGMMFYMCFTYACVCEEGAVWWLYFCMYVC